MRLIDARAYCKELCAERDYPSRSQEFIDAIEVAIADLGDMPTIDAVPVVRCKNCQHYWKNVNTFGYDGVCTTVSDNDFCSKGKRKDDDSNG